MALVQKLSDEEIALLEIIEDPILFGEFMRNTGDGSMIKDEWPKQKFQYRWYQKDILSDQSPYIIWSAGRAVGKCQPINAQIYTPYGYLTIRDILKQFPRGIFPIYAKDDDGNFVVRRAIVKRDGSKQIWRLNTETGYQMEGSKEHPIMTQRGWIRIDELDPENDVVAVVRKLPFPVKDPVFNWYEARALGYLFAHPGRVHPQMELSAKYQAQVLELNILAKAFGMELVKSELGYNFKRVKNDRLKSTLSSLMSQIDNDKEYNRQWNTEIPALIREDSLDVQKTFLESYTSINAVIEKDKIVWRPYFPEATRNLQEMLLHFGIETKIVIVPHFPPGLEHMDKEDAFYERRPGTFTLETIDMYSFAEFLSNFKIPGVTIKNVPTVIDDNSSKNYRFEKIASLVKRSEQPVYAIMVHEFHNYITSNIIVHNSLTLEDMMVWESVNEDFTFPVTKEQTLATANVNQLTPILDRLSNRFSGSALLKTWLPQVNRSKGTIDFPTTVSSRIYRINARIAGSNGQSNMVGLHVNKIKVDECQLFPWSAYIQMLPTLNTWEPLHRMLFTGVPNGGTTGNVLWYLDQKNSKYKKYRTPAHENPFFTYSDNIEALRQYGGEESDDYKQLILGHHGNPVFTVIPREKMLFEPYEFFTYRFSQTDKNNGRTFRDVLKLPETNAEHRDYVVFAMDTGYADPTVIEVMGMDSKNKWRTLARYRLTRIPFPEQALIVDYLFDFWQPSHIGIDLGAGGGGIALMQDLSSSRFDKSKNYEERIYGVRFGDTITAGEDLSGNPLKYAVKSWAGQQLATVVGEHQMILSELDQEGASQLERVSYQRRSDGSMRFFVMSEKGHGEADDDHIFASYVVFVTMLSFIEIRANMRKPTLFTAGWI